MSFVERNVGRVARLEVGRRMISSALGKRVLQEHGAVALALVRWIDPDEHGEDLGLQLLLQHAGLQRRAQRLFVRQDSGGSHNAAPANPLRWCPVPCSKALPPKARTPAGKYVRCWTGSGLTQRHRIGAEGKLRPRGPRAG